MQILVNYNYCGAGVVVSNNVLQHRPNLKREMRMSCCSSSSLISCNTPNTNLQSVSVSGGGGGGGGGCGGGGFGGGGLASSSSFGLCLYEKVGLKKEDIPQRVAIILDGNRRWLRSHGKPLSYEPFFQANSLFADLCLKWGVSTATSFVYSFKNLSRGKEANDLIFGQLERYLEENLQEFIRKEIKVSMIGERWALPKSLKDKIEQVEEETRKKDTSHQLEFMLAICYAGTREIVKATRSICDKVKSGVIESSKDIDESLLDQELWTRDAPHPDLLIRTGGRLRISDYLMWQLAQTELYFTHILAPEFNEVEFIQALHSFQQRERTFGK